MQCVVRLTVPLGGLVGATSGAVWGRSEQQDFRSRVRGTLLGVAVGDALGGPADALSLEEIRTAYGPEGLLDSPSGTGGAARSPITPSSPSSAWTD